MMQCCLPLPQEEEHVARKPVHWITSSAWTNSGWRIVIPRERAVLKLTTRTNLLGSSTGRFSGLAPRRM
jgi:hypothetical protein